MMLNICRRYALFATLIVFLILSCQGPDKEVYQKQSFSRKGMVVSAHQLATKIGLEIMRKGGNAVDAAIATHFALAVVYPRAGNLGGGGFLVFRNKDGDVKALDFRETAPFASGRDMFLDSTGNPIAMLSTEGGLAIGVPGSVAGMWEMYQKLQPNLPFQELLTPAIELAENGFEISQDEADRLNTYRDDFLRNNSSHEMPFLKPEQWERGDLLVQEKLAASLRKIAAEGAAGFYTGENAEALVETVIERNGLMSLKDLSDYRAIWREPTRISFKQYTIYTMPPPSSGGITLGQILKMMEPFSLDSNTMHTSYNLHLFVEASKRAFADRAVYLGDPDFVSIPTKELLSGKYLREKMKDYSPERASQVEQTLTGDVKVDKEHFETTHFSITDPEGNSIAITTTLNGNFGSKVWVPNGGYFLNNEMDDFSIKPGTSNQFELVSGDANAIAPEKRMLSSMTPTIIEKDGAFFMALGSPGGPTIISSVAQVFINVAEFGMVLADAVAIGRVHHQWIPNEIWIERNRVSENIIVELESKGHSTKMVERMGSVNAIILHQTGSFEGAADPRDESHAEGL